MQNWLDDNNVLMYSTHNKAMSVVPERFIRTLKGKIYRLMTANDSKSYLDYLHKLVDECNNTYHSCIGKKPVDTDYSTLTKEIETNLKSPKFRVGDRVRIIKY